MGPLVPSPVACISSNCVVRAWVKVLSWVSTPGKVELYRLRRLEIAAAAHVDGLRRSSRRHSELSLVVKSGSERTAWFRAQSGASDRDVDLAGLLLYGLDINQLRKVGDRLIAGVEQAIGILSAGGDGLDLLIQLSNLG